MITRKRLRWADYLGTVELFRRNRPSWAHADLDAALAGDVEQAFNILLEEPNHRRPAFALLFYLRGVADDAYRTVLSGAWEHDHQHMLHQIDRAALRAIFAAARFPVDHLPKSVRIWRGYRTLSAETAARGLAWTTDRDTACWFATVWHNVSAGEPLVLTAVIPRRSVMMHHVERNENEVLCFNVKDATVDGTLDDWQEAGQRHKAVIRPANAAVVAASMRANNGPRTGIPAPVTTS